MSDTPAGLAEADARRLQQYADNVATPDFRIGGIERGRLLALRSIATPAEADLIDVVVAVDRARAAGASLVVVEQPPRGRTSRAYEMGADRAAATNLRGQA